MNSFRFMSLLQTALGRVLLWFAFSSPREDGLSPAQNYAFPSHHLANPFRPINPYHSSHRCIPAILRITFKTTIHQDLAFTNRYCKDLRTIIDITKTMLPSFRYPPQQSSHPQQTSPSLHVPPVLRFSEEDILPKLVTDLLVYLQVSFVTFIIVTTSKLRERRVCWDLLLICKHFHAFE